MAIEIKAGKLSSGKNVHALIKNVNTNGYLIACDKKVSCEPDPSIPLEQISCKSCLRLKFVQDGAKVSLPLTLPPAESIKQEPVPVKQEPVPVKQEPVPVKQEPVPVKQGQTRTSPGQTRTQSRKIAIGENSGS
jgi:hypothetical protein